MDLRVKKSPISEGGKIILFFLACFLTFGTENAFASEAKENRIFNVNPGFDYSGRTRISATLRQTGDKAYFYVDEEWWQTADKETAVKTISDLSVEFDKIIYPKLTQSYGSEWSPGIDGDLRIAVLVSKMKNNVGGYFDNTDEFPKSIFPLSNESELIYLNTSFLNTPKIKVYLAHEFQHLISFYQKEKLRNIADEVWLNEARSEYASTICGYDNNFSGSNLEKRVKEFLQNSSDSLVEWKEENADYAPVDLFMQYFASRYGQSVLDKIMKNELAGIASIDRALADSGFSDKFSEVFFNWEIANYANNCLLGEGKKYCYLNSNLGFLRVLPNLTNNLPADKDFSFSFSDYLKDWSLHGYKISGGGDDSDLIISLSGEAAAKFKVAALVSRADGEKYLKFFDLGVSAKASETFLDFGREIKEIILIPLSQSKTGGFSANEPTHLFSYSLKLISNKKTSSSNLTPSSSPAPSPLPESYILPSEQILPSPSKQTSEQASSVPALPKESENLPKTESDAFFLPLSLDYRPSYSDGSLIRAKNDSKVYVLMGKFKRWLQAPEILSMYPHFFWQNVIETSVFDKNWYQEVWLVRAAQDTRVYEINGDGTKHWLNLSAEDFSNSGRDWKMVCEINKKELEWYKTGADVIK